MKTLSSFYLLIFISCGSILNACRESNGVDFNVHQPDYSDNYNYYPIKDGNQWFYDYTFTDTVTHKSYSYEQNARYSADSSINVYYKNGELWSYTTWKNSGNKLYCCGDMVLMDYNRLDCNSDSTIIYSNFDSSKNITKINFQNCKSMYVAEVPAYSNTKCVRTLATVKYTSGNRLEIIRYFGYKVGLVYEENRYYGSNGSLTEIETLKLKSHKFN